MADSPPPPSSPSAKISIKSEDQKAIDSLAEEERAQVDKTVEETYQRTLNLYAKKLLENNKRIDAIEKGRAARESSSRPLAKKSNTNLKDDLERLEQELAALKHSIDDLTPTVQTLEDRYSKKLADAERRSRRSGRSSPLIRK
jgi:phosphoenolpyruvate carboxylase